MSLLSICITKKAQFSGLKVIKRIQSSDSIQLPPVNLNAYKLMYFDRNINWNKDGKVLRGDYQVLCTEWRISLYYIYCSLAGKKLLYKKAKWTSLSVLIHAAPLWPEYPNFVQKLWSFKKIIDKWIIMIQ